ncbi:hypothetical protein AOQ84DRAFT_229434, partial [Glonium stellatum]
LPSPPLSPPGVQPPPAIRRLTTATASPAPTLPYPILLPASVVLPGSSCPQRLSVRLPVHLLVHLRTSDQSVRPSTYQSVHLPRPSTPSTHLSCSSHLSVHRTQPASAHLPTHSPTHPLTHPPTFPRPVLTLTSPRPCSPSPLTSRLSPLASRLSPRPSPAARNIGGKSWSRLDPSAAAADRSELSGADEAGGANEIHRRAGPRFCLRGWVRGG